MKFRLDSKGMIWPSLELGAENSPANHRKVCKKNLAIALLLAPFCVFDVIMASVTPDGAALGFVVAGMVTSLGLIYFALKSLRVW